MAVVCAACNCTVEVIFGGDEITVASQYCDGSGCIKGDTVTALNRANLGLKVRIV
ncbi:MAG: hypothetical protein UX80_C0003G0006 [Candidatus Amesbacteria bacterium GW2011_GWA2_47_11b]|uniref:Uncharacterized protein n=2 Tax=Candidatus Amesiibacteriota TaxID=1752730 RepID=A0A0G1SEW3_9BACT|nr:MAG: hypothetical protein UX42_C0022G0004 [Microgenomates group bacterium GW2011_GWC1_46_20]KKU58351.1 MAG: hypothetical protein UX80_C0003G0006 [Candidatus Amesbacteria bacterium GW2011_GWA2_47_11b]KKU67999.1 MAG: hypothetical protein UX92_C0025G0003 [Candidatus Amesbacteria bacterium GW2011_GWA1_47_20]